MKDKFKWNKVSERFRKYTYDEITARDKTSLDIFWLKDNNLNDLDILLDPDTIAEEINENIESVLLSFKEVENGLNRD